MNIRNSYRVIATSVTLGIFVVGCAKNEAAPPPPPGVPVVVSKVSQKLMPVEVSAVGNVEAISTVAIKSLVAGQLLDIHFKEGDFVTKGQLLVTIDPAPFEATVAQSQATLEKDRAQLQLAEANLARDTANQQYAQSQAQRYSTLNDKGLITKENAEQIRTQAAALSELVRADQAAVASMRANLSADEAALNAAKLQWSYCKIFSPIDGRTGTVMLKPGNLVKAADVPIVVINQVNPIYVNFTVVQQYWPEIKKRMAAGSLKVKATVPQDTGQPLDGSVAFVDNAVDPTTGTIHLRASFENSQHRLWPGLFVNATLKLSEQPNATVVPSQAVVDGQNGSMVYVVKQDSTVEVRPVVSPRASGGLSVIDKGLEPGELVVIDGQTRLTNGAKVQVKGQS
jgi:multidrug efflux system membrane fusion protein